MKESFVDIRQVFPQMPAACEQALMRTVYTLPAAEPVRSFRAGRRFAILAAALLAFACAAGAAFSPRIVEWFTAQYGAEYGAWLQDGQVAVSLASVEEGGAVFTIDEVLVRGRGLYVMGRIQAADGYVVVDYDCSADDPWGYNIHYGEEAPQGTPTILQKAAETGSSIRYVSCYLERIGVDGGAMLAPSCWGYGVTVQRDGSLVFTMEVEDGMAVEPGAEYTLELCAQSFGAHADGSLNPEDRSQRIWTVTVVPEVNQ